MSLKYYLYPDKLMPEKNQYYAKVKTSHVITFDEIATKILQRGTTVNREDIISVLSLFQTVVQDEILDGNRINTPFANFTPIITNSFSSETEKFNHEKHEVYISVSAGSLFKKAIKNINVEKISKITARPQIISFIDTMTNENNKAKIGNLFKITGTDLKFGENEQEGIFFIKTETNNSFKIEQIGQKTRGSLIFNLPPLMLPGIYMIEVRKSYTKDQIIRKAEYHLPVEVIEA